MLRAQLAAVNLRNAEITRQAEENARRAEENARRAEENARRVDEVNSPTTFEDFLQVCHEALFEPFTVQTDKTLATAGTHTKVKDKPCPKRLQHWRQFSTLQQEAFDSLYSLLYPTGSPDNVNKIFFSRSALHSYATVIPNSKKASEQDLRMFQSTSVEYLVQHVFSRVAQNPQFRESLGLGINLSFMNHSNDADSDLSAPITNYADQYCVHDLSETEKVLVFIIEYKPPHKLTKEYLRLGLHDMNVLKDVVSISKVPEDKTKQDQYWAERLTAAAMSQTYRYMLECGTPYGCLTTGEAIIFLCVEEDDPSTLYYHLSEPKLDVRDASGVFQHPRTAIAQMISLFLMAKNVKKWGRDCVSKALAEAVIWNKDFDTVLHEMPMSVRNSPPTSPAYKPTKFGAQLVKRSPYFIRQSTKNPRKPTLEVEEDIPNIKFHHDDDDDDDDDDNEDRDNRGPGPQGRAHRKFQPFNPFKTPTKKSRNGRRDDPGNWQRSESRQHLDRPYCTLRCMIGLAQRSALDENCPHVNFHRGGDGGKHALTKEKVCYLMRKQLARTLEWNCSDLNIRGARGRLIKLSLASHGYTFVAKGTQETFVPYLRHEARMYNRLSALQGHSIPIRLGSIDLVTPWIDHQGYMVHMLLLAYGGLPVDEVGKTGPDLERRVKEFDSELANFSVQHNDLWTSRIRYPNMLWNEEFQRILFIDFERSTTRKENDSVDVEQVRNALAHWKHKQDPRAESCARWLRQLEETQAAEDALFEDQNPRPSPKKGRSRPDFQKFYEDDQPFLLPIPSPVKAINDRALEASGSKEVYSGFTAKLTDSKDFTGCRMAPDTSNPSRKSPQKHNESTKENVMPKRVFK